MAFGIDRKTLTNWKKSVREGQISFLTHYWIDERFPGCKTVTKVGCSDINKLICWGKQHGLKAEWIHFDKEYPHFDLFGERQKEILLAENQMEQLKNFNNY
ncbi:hypothetical protein SAMN04487944_101215 [Gracilibacillus ureilyticus]|uniref:YneQ n=1 Tax=Gracilibacillus ureilyticus TaxID=531814 RepID=A0A1H9LEJ9_9BACI|nr:hypothetical protein [Gracilibacillus ureilyticus]SER09627.1 hypothetical protein SAMN04487944_101215 [Gracilibacillus ureilyticus]